MKSANVRAYGYTMRERLPAQDDGCETKDDYIRAIVNGEMKEPPDEGGETGE